MEYSKIVAVTGLPGLYELLSSKGDGAIVRSLEDGNTRFASSRVHNFSHLESIEIFTIRDNVNLVDVFHAMEKAAGSLPDGKDAAALKKYFEATYPDIDFERVYTSDLKKMVKWFDILKKVNVGIKLSEPEQEEEPVEEVEVPEVKEEKKKAPAKKAATTEVEEKPKKKTPVKESKEETEEKKAPAAKKAPAKKAAATEVEEKPKKKAPAKKK